MRKKLALFGGSLTLLVGTFAGLCYLADVNPFRARATPAPPASTGQADDIPLEYEARDSSGTLEYVLAAKRAIPQGQGKYQLDHPKATYYLRNNQLVVISADVGAIRMDQLAAGPEKLRVVGGSLSDNVKLTIGPAETFTSPDDTTRQPGQIQAAFEAPIQFDYEDRTIESHGPIQVRSDQVNFDGANLMLTLNMEARRIEFLRVEPQAGGGRIVLKDVGKGELAMGGGTAQAGAGRSAAPANGAAEAPHGHAEVEGGAAPAAAPGGKAGLGRATYRLTFGHDVHATLGSVNLTAEQLAVLFQTTSQGDARPVGKPEASGGGDAADAANPAGGASAPSTVAHGGAASQPAQAQDLVLTWTGPMEMRPVDDPQAQKLAAAGMAFEATGTVQQPVVVKSADGSMAKAGVLRYTRSDELITLLPGALPEVELSRSGTDAVQIDAPAASYSQKTHALAFWGGPGHLDTVSLAGQEGGASGQKSQPFHADWQDRLDVQLLEAAEAGKRGGAGAADEAVLPKLALRQAIFHGAAHLSDPTFELGGDVVNLMLQPQDAVQKRVALEHLLATGHVRVTSFAAGRPKDKPNTLEADRLEVASARDAAGQIVPRVVTAEGHVVGVNYDPVKDKPGALARQKISGPNLQVELAEKGTSDEVTGRRDDGATAGLGGFKPERLTASGGVSVELGGMGNEPVVATAYGLDALVSTGTVRLQGRTQGPAVQLARLQQGVNQIEGRSILLDRDAQTIQIPGPGDFVFEQGENGKKPTPVQIAWTQRMDYSGKTGDALFAGPVTVSLLGNPLQESSLTADMLYASGLPANGLGQGKGAGEPKGKTSAKIRAEGHVVARGKTFSAQHKLETEMLLKNVDVAIYDGPQQTLLVPGPGEVFFGDYRPEPARTSGQDARNTAGGTPASRLTGGAPAARPAGQTNFSTRGTQAMSWSRRLLYDASAHQMQAQGNVLLVVKPTTPAVVPLPASGGATQDQRIERITLRSGDLTALVQPRGDAPAANPLAMGANQSGLELKSVTATTNATLILNDGSASVQSEQLSYDRLTGRVTAGGPDQTVRYVLADGGQGRAQSVLWDIPSGSFTIGHSQGSFEVPAQQSNFRP